MSEPSSRGSSAARPMTPHRNILQQADDSLALLNAEFGGAQGSHSKRQMSSPARPLAGDKGGRVIEGWVRHCAGGRDETENALRMLMDREQEVREQLGVQAKALLGFDRRLQSLEAPRGASPIKGEASRQQGFAESDAGGGGQRVASVALMATDVEDLGRSVRKQLEEAEVQFGGLEQHLGRLKMEAQQHAEELVRQLRNQHAGAAAEALRGEASAQQMEHRMEALELRIDGLLDRERQVEPVAFSAASPPRSPSQHGHILADNQRRMDSLEAGLFGMQEKQQETEAVSRTLQRQMSNSEGGIWELCERRLAPREADRARRIEALERSVASLLDAETVDAKQRAAVQERGLRKMLDDAEGGLWVRCQKRLDHIEKDTRMRVDGFANKATGTLELQAKEYADNHMSGMERKLTDTDGARWRLCEERLSGVQAEALDHIVAFERRVLNLFEEERDRGVNELKSQSSALAEALQTSNAAHMDTHMEAKLEAKVVEHRDALELKLANLVEAERSRINGVEARMGPFETLESRVATLLEAEQDRASKGLESKLGAQRGVLEKMLGDMAEDHRLRLKASKAAADEELEVLHGKVAEHGRIVDQSRHAAASLESGLSKHAAALKEVDQRAATQQQLDLMEARVMAAINGYAERSQEQIAKLEATPAAQPRQPEPAKLKSSEQPSAQVLLPLAPRKSSLSGAAGAVVQDPSAAQQQLQQPSVSSSIAALVAGASTFAEARSLARNSFSKDVSSMGRFDAQRVSDVSENESSAAPENAQLPSMADLARTDDTVLVDTFIALKAWLRSVERKGELSKAGQELDPDHRRSILTFIQKVAVHPSPASGTAMRVKVAGELLAKLSSDRGWTEAADSARAASLAASMGEAAPLSGRRSIGSERSSGRDSSQPGSPTNVEGGCIGPLATMPHKMVVSQPQPPSPQVGSFRSAGLPVASVASAGHLETPKAEGPATAVVTPAAGEREDETRRSAAHVDEPRRSVPPPADSIAARKAVEQQQQQQQQQLQQHQQQQEPQQLQQQQQRSAAVPAVEPLSIVTPPEKLGRSVTPPAEEPRRSVTQPTEVSRGSIGEALISEDARRRVTAQEFEVAQNPNVIAHAEQPRQSETTNDGDTRSCVTLSNMDSAASTAQRASVDSLPSTGGPNRVSRGNPGEASWAARRKSSMSSNRGSQNRSSVASSRQESGRGSLGSADDDEDSQDYEEEDEEEEQDDEDEEDEEDDEERTDDEDNPNVGKPSATE